MVPTDGRDLMDKANPPAEAIGLVASIFVERAGRGTSIRELQASIESRLAGRPDAILKLREIVTKTLGATQRQAEDSFFDLNLAVGSIAFFDLNEIPAIRDTLPSRVSRVRFTSDLSNEPEIDIDVTSNTQPSLTAYNKWISREK